jgi:hypothetical protein
MPDCLPNVSVDPLPLLPLRSGGSVPDNSAEETLWMINGVGHSGLA